MDNHGSSFNPPMRPRTFAEIPVWFAGADLENLIFVSDTSYPSLGISFREQQFNTDQLDWLIPSQLSPSTRHCKSA
jgi:hypothetical protein